ncbi:MAG: GIY-YIG nuclease family protein [Ignavibacteria bacterium]|nr:GIY-YIG nuclease family protein [Ignavibacteria bacterium]
MRTYYVYILASKKNGTLYVGVTNNLVRRVVEHKEKLVKGFTFKYNVDKLVYYEVFESINLAIERETVMKKWNRKWKIRMIEKNNFEWEDLLFKIAGTEEIDAMKKFLHNKKDKEGSVFRK